MEIFNYKPEPVCSGHVTVQGIEMPWDLCALTGSFYSAMARMEDYRISDEFAAGSKAAAEFQKDYESLQRARQALDQPGTPKSTLRSRRARCNKLMKELETRLGPIEAHQKAIKELYRDVLLSLSCDKDQLDAWFDAVEWPPDKLNLLINRAANLVRDAMGKSGPEEKKTIPGGKRKRR